MTGDSCDWRRRYYNDLSESAQSEVLNAIQRFDVWKGYQLRAPGAAMMAQ